MLREIRQYIGLWCPGDGVKLSSVIFKLCRIYDHVLSMGKGIDSFITPTMHQIVFRRLLSYAEWPSIRTRMCFTRCEGCRLKIDFRKAKMLIDTFCNIDPCRRPWFYLNGCQVMKHWSKLMNTNARTAEYYCTMSLLRCGFWESDPQSNIFGVMQLFYSMIIPL